MAGILDNTVLGARGRPGVLNLTEYHPTWRDRIARSLLGDAPSLPRLNFVGGLMGSKGLGQSGVGLVDFTPAGVPIAVQEAYRAGSARDIALAVMPGGRAAGAPVRGVSAGLPKVADEIKGPASKSVGVLKAPITPSRPLETDYLAGVPGEASARLTQHVEGRPFAEPMAEAPYAVRRFTPAEVRRVSKSAENVGQRAIFDGNSPDTLPVGNWSEFIRSPEFHRRVDEMYQAGRGYMSKQPTPVWFEGPAFRRVYGDRAPTFTDLVAATSPNTSLTPNLRDASEYMRRSIRGEPLVQPNYRTPEGLLAHEPGKKMSIGQTRASNLRRIENGTPEQLQRDKVAHQGRALRGDLTAAPLERHLVRLSEDPARGIYAIGNLGSFSGKPYGELYDQFAAAAQRHDRPIRDFVADVYVGIRNQVRDHSELFGTKFRPGSVRGESKSYNDIFEDLLEQGAQTHRLSKRDFERRLAAGDVSLLSGFLAVPAVAGLLSEISAESPPREGPDL